MQFIRMTVVAMCLFPWVAQAQVLEYEWVDFHGQGQTISIDLPYDRLENAMLSGKDQVSQQSILSLSYQFALDIAGQANTQEKPVRVAGTEQRFFFSIDGNDKAADTELAQDLRHQLVLSINQSPERGYFTFDEKANGLRPDYMAIVADNQDVFSAFAHALVYKFGKKDPVELISQLLAMLQQIRYDDMLEEPFPMATPIQLLVEKRGDCEAKQVFLIGVLEQLFPDRPMGLVNLPTFNHVLAAISLDAELDSKVMHDGKPFILMDATGPAPQKFGEVFQYYRDAEVTSWIGV